MQERRTLYEQRYADKQLPQLQYNFRCVEEPAVPSIRTRFGPTRDFYVSAVIEGASTEVAGNVAHLREGLTTYPRTSLWAYGLLVP